MKSLSKASLALFSLLALGGISASANSKNNHQNTNDSANQLETTTFQNSDIDQANSKSDNNITHVSNDYNQDTNHVNDLREHNSNQNAPINSIRTINVNQLRHNHRRNYYMINHHSSHIAKRQKINRRQSYPHNHSNVMKLGTLSMKMTREHNTKFHYNNHKRIPSWFTDGLSHKQLKARHWIVYHESGGHWNILSYGHVCVGRYQLSPGYLGYKHGRVNLDHRHQTIVADKYVRLRYGSWVHAQAFWENHHWY